MPDLSTVVTERVNSHSQALKSSRKPFQKRKICSVMFKKPMRVWGWGALNVTVTSSNWYTALLFYKYMLSIHFVFTMNYCYYLVYITVNAFWTAFSCYFYLQWMVNYSWAYYFCLRCNTRTLGAIFVYSKCVVFWWEVRWGSVCLLLTNSKACKYCMYIWRIKRFWFCAHTIL